MKFYSIILILFVAINNLLLLADKPLDSNGLELKKAKHKNNQTRSSDLITKPMKKERKIVFTTILAEPRVKTISISEFCGTTGFKIGSA